MSEAVMVTDVEVRFGDVIALPRTSLSVKAGESVALMGPSGSGKTTMLDCLSGLQVPTSGRVTVGGSDLAELSSSARAEIRRRHVGLVFQAPELLPELDVAENVALTLLFDGVDQRTARDAARAALEQVGLADKAKRRPEELSGGEAQRVAVARALVRDSVTLVIADEPTASLDVDNAAAITELLVSWAARSGAALVLATHDPAVAARCDRTVRIARRGANGQDTPG